jgi:tryptophanyl-tRNA synthetase
MADNTLPPVENLSLEDNQAAKSEEQKVTPWEVEGAVVDGKQQEIDYLKLINQFGTRHVDEAVLERFEKLTGRKPHILLRRGMFFSHRYNFFYYIEG